MGARVRQHTATATRPERRTPPRHWLHRQDIQGGRTSEGAAKMGLLKEPDPPMGLRQRQPAYDEREENAAHERPAGGLGEHEADHRGRQSEL